MKPISMLDMEAKHIERLQKLYYFAREVLGYNQLTELHLSWFDILLREKKVLLVCPPGHLKTTSLTMAYPLFRLTEDPNMKILIINEILDNAKGFLREIKAHIQQNEKFRERFGNWDMTAHAWTEDRIQIPRTEIRKEPSIAVSSVLGTTVSVHPDLICVDDPSSNRNTQTHNQRQKIINWFRKDLLPRIDEDHGQVLVTMTRWHNDDLAGFIMNDPGFDDWKVINMPAEWEEDGKRKILFPEKFYPEKLDRIKKQMGTSAYNLLYRGMTRGGGKEDFKEAWIESGRYETIPKETTTFAGIDLAISEKEKAARFAYSIIEVDKNGDVYIKDMYRDRIPFPEQLKAAKRLNRIHHPRLIVVEVNAYQSAFVQSLRTDPETRLLPIRTIHSTHDKDARLRGMAPLFENGFIRVPKYGGEWIDQLIEELTLFPEGTKDMLDALWMALQGLQIQRTEPKIMFADDVGDHHRRHSNGTPRPYAPFG